MYRFTKQLLNTVIAILCLLFVPGQTRAQTQPAQGTDDYSNIVQYIQKVMNFNVSIPQEKVYMHFDNTGYFENETMWFKAYVTRTDKQRATDLSQVLYVELLNPSGDVVKTQKLHIDEKGQAYGDMKLDTLFGTGFYEVRAYTRYMTNWGVNAVFSRVFPVFKAPKEEGDFRDLTLSTKLYKQRDPNNRDLQDSLYTKAVGEGVYTSELAKTISAQFYPEGGDLLVGKKCRVAMLAVNDNGRPYQGKGTIVNAAGQVVSSVETDSLGRGLFTVTPDGSALTLKMANMQGKEQKFPLPNAKTEGCALTMDVIGETILATLQCSPKACDRLLGYAIMNNGNILFCDTLTGSPLIELELNRATMKEGVNQFTLFNSHGQILADRLFFICPERTPSDSIFFKSNTPFLKPCGKVDLDVQTLPNTTFSFSAIDAGTMTNGKQGNLKTWMLLSSEVRGYIHNVEYYFEADDEEHRRAADMLMLTQGWRRYDWNLMSGTTTFEKPQPIEDQFYMFGKLEPYRKRNEVSEVSLQAYLFNESGQSLSGSTTTDSLGNYAFALPFLDGEWKMQIFTKVDDKRKTFRVGIDRQFSPKPRYITPVEASVMPPLLPNMFVIKPGDPEPEEEFIPITQKNHLLENVTVKAKRRYFTNDDWTYQNENFASQYATLFYDIDRERDNLLDLGEDEPTLFQFLCRKNALFNNPEGKDLPSPSELDGSEYAMWKGKMSYANRPIKWIVDNGETQMLLDTAYAGSVASILGISKNDPDLFIEWVTNEGKYAMASSEVGSIGDPFFPLWMEEVKSLYIVPESPKETQGCVRIYLYTHKKYSTASNKGLRRTYFQGFNTPSTFQMEDYNVIPPMADFRRTIYWAPNVTTDAQGKAHVTFFNNSTCTGMYISAEGMNDEGKCVVH
ncbi:MAG: hypothetical protein IJ693_01470 [Bacteroidaceae bacterium]|nr:hypothetical protein [Bacteroidaceae bacterium]